MSNKPSKTPIDSAAPGAETADRDEGSVLSFARSVIEHEQRALQSLASTLDEQFLRAVELILSCRNGHVVVTGMGKAWLVGKKISATLASTGTPSFDLHAGEALHGDLGRIRPGDVVIALSNSGRTREVVELVEALKRIRVSLISITGARDSALAENSDCVLSIGQLDEACPLRLAPSTTTTAMLALGDALALTVQRARNFTPEDYAFFHPAGSLGRKLMKVAEIMRTGDDAPVISEQAEVRVAIVETSRSRAGAISVVDDSGRLVGIFTNGDLRRHFGEDRELGARRMHEVMTRKPKTTSPERLVAEVHAVLKEYRIDELPVVDREGRPVGMVDIQDLLRLDR